jgi:hypothetical protein
MSCMVDALFARMSADWLIAMKAKVATATSTCATTISECADIFTSGGWQLAGAGVRTLSHQVLKRD